MSARCSHCLMPTDNPRAHRAPDHEYPYAAESYGGTDGRCEGSGRGTLPGTGTPPAVWDYASRQTYMDLGILPSPIPQIDRDGWRVTLTGLRYTYRYQCTKCRQQIGTTADTGRAELGFNARGRAYQQPDPGPPPTYSGPCLNDDCDATLTIRPGTSPASALPVADAETHQSREWVRLRRDLAVYTVDMTAADLARLR